MVSICDKFNLQQVSTWLIPDSVPDQEPEQKLGPN
jgi:hypothetical protein